MDYGIIIEKVKATKNTVLNERLKNDIHLKAKADFVTEVDLSISAQLKKALAEITPQYGFMSEEEKKDKFTNPRWILDPIDGTTNLVYGFELSSVSLALLSGDKIVFGVVYNPFNDEIFTAERGKGAYHNGKPMQKVKDREISDCIIEFGAGTSRKYESEEIFGIANQIFDDCLDLRRMCSSALAVSYVACGRLNGYFEKSLKPWDYAAASLILEECGGIVTNMKGEPINYDKPDSIIAASPKAHKYLLEKFNGLHFKKNASLF